MGGRCEFGDYGIGNGVAVRILVLLAFACVARADGPATKYPDETGGQAAVVKPSREELDAPDMKKVLTLQREQYMASTEVNKLKAEMESKRADMWQMQRQLDKANKEMVELLNELRLKYNCPGCEVTGDMKWSVKPEPPQK